jgi:hypothetical protein
VDCTLNLSMRALIDRYRCPEDMIASFLTGPLSDENGYFRLGQDLICYGRSSSGSQVLSPNEPLADLIEQIKVVEGEVALPFDLTQVIDSLRYELFVPPSRDGEPAGGPSSLLRNAYYSIRPLLPVSVRKHLQRLYFHRRKKELFPRWPLDSTVEDLFETLLPRFIRATRAGAIPFIWFWPDGATAATIMTHDVETSAGLAFCPKLMEIDESFGFRSSFQIVPEGRYPVSSTLLENMVGRGHEVNIQDLNHDGQLFRERMEFERRVKAVNRYGQQFGAKGFRAGCLYHNLSWYEHLEFEYDMSVPNTGHLEPQLGGCCSVFPYFIGNVLELPVTTTQDYSLFHILGDYKLDLWRLQTAGVINKHGLLSFIVHPDYLLDERAIGTYRNLLTFLADSQVTSGLWMSTPNQVNQWWRQRSLMTLASHNGRWRVEGPGSERAVVAFARLVGDQLVYDFRP